MGNPKVFEFAKEIGMTPLALMDKIRGFLKAADDRYDLGLFVESDRGRENAGH